MFYSHDILHFLYEVANCLHEISHSFLQLCFYILMLQMFLIFPLAIVIKTVWKWNKETLTQTSGIELGSKTDPKM